tara:strand:- start:650 stop:913 length:264 start_codon:yes stop_codon:yes gene_type:complete
LTGPFATLIPIDLNLRTQQKLTAFLFEDLLGRMQFFCVFRNMTGRFNFHYKILEGVAFQEEIWRVGAKLIEIKPKRLMVQLLEIWAE